MQIRFLLRIILFEKAWAFDIKYPLSPAYFLAGNKNTEHQGEQYTNSKHPASVGRKRCEVRNRNHCGDQQGGDRNIFDETVFMQIDILEPLQIDKRHDKAETTKNKGVAKQDQLRFIEAFSLFKRDSFNIH